MTSNENESQSGGAGEREGKTRGWLCSVASLAICLLARFLYILSAAQAICLASGTSDTPTMEVEGVSLVARRTRRSTAGNRMESVMAEVALLESQDPHELEDDIDFVQKGTIASN
jgi:hypothetical protein